MERDSIKNDRQVGPEVLRCVAMMMVVVLHFLWKGGVLELCASNMSDTTAVAWIFESFSIAAVNIYVLISGYYLCDSNFKIRRLFRLIIQVWFYSVVIGILSVKLGLYPAEAINAEFLLNIFFPLMNSHYWFVTEYIKLYILLPILGIALQKITDQTLKRILLIYFIFFCCA